MGFQSKTYSLSDEVVEAIQRLRKQYGSPNKAFTAILLKNSEFSEKKDIYGGFPGRKDVKDLEFEPDDHDPDLAQANIDNFREAFGRRGG